MLYISKHNKFPTLRSSLYMSYPRYNYHTRNNNEMIQPYSRLEAIRMNFGYQFIKFWLGVPEYNKCQRTWTSFKCSPTDYYLSRYWRLYYPILSAVYFLFVCKLIIIVGYIIVTINNVFLFILYREFASGLYVWQLESLFYLLWH